MTEKKKEWADLTDEQQAAHLQAVKRYDEQTAVNIHLKLNIRTDQDIIKWLWKQPNKQGAIKKIIRDQIREKGAESVRAETGSGTPGNGTIQPA